jgi:hypothetical protein
MVIAGGTRGDVNYVVDFDNKTVNGFPATITDNTIQFDQQQRSVGGKATTRINRLSGSVVWMSDDGIFGNGECVKATQRQF